MAKAMIARQEKRQPKEKIVNPQYRDVLETKGQNGGGAFGGGIFAEGTGSFISTLSIHDAYVANNSVTAGNAAVGGNAAGGGITTQNTSVNFERVKVISNSATGGNSTTQGTPGPGAGGGLYIFALRSGIPRATITNIIVADNQAAQGEGTTTSGNGGAGGMIIHGMDADINHATFAENRIISPLVLGHGLVVQPWTLVNGELPANVNLHNSIIANHTGGGRLATAVTNQIGSTLTFQNGIFSGNTKDTNADNSPVPAGAINGLNTMQTTDSVNFISPGFPDNNYYIQIDSPAKDQALTSTTVDDVEGNNRPFDISSDLGAYEYWPLNLSVGIGDSTLRLNWTKSVNKLIGGVSFYKLQVTCPQGANPPDQVGCGQILIINSDTSINLTGLSNYKKYSILIQAFNASENLIASSNYTYGFPTDIIVFIPLTTR